MKLRKWFAAALAVPAALCGCMHVECDVTETYPETADIHWYKSPEQVPHAYTVMGQCRVSGAASDFSRDDMFRRLVRCGEAKGADAVLITEMKLQPDGTRVETSTSLRTLETTSPGMTNTFITMDRDFEGGYGRINRKNDSLAVTYRRIISAELLRYRRDDAGEPLPPAPVEKAAAETPALQQ